MTLFRTLLVSVALLGGFGAAWNLIDARMGERDEALRVAASIEKAERALAAALQQMELSRQEDTEGEAREQRTQAAVIQELGGPRQAALKNPDTGIAASIEGLARAVIPHAAAVSVRVDRFVEFQLMIELPTPVDDAQMMGWSRQLLLPMHRYLHAIRFVAAGAVVGALDRPAIEAAAREDASTGISDWTRRLHGGREGQAGGGRGDPPVGATNGAAGSGVRPREAGSLVARDPGSERELRVNEELTAAIQTQSKQFAEGLRNLHETINRLGTEGPVGLVPVREAVRGFRERLPTIRRYLADPAGELDRRLQEAGADEVYRRAAVRTFRQDYTAARDAERMIAQARRYSDVLLGFLDTMEKHRVGWIALPEVQKIQFLDPDLFEVYQEGALACEREKKETQASIDAWSAEVEKGHERSRGR